MPTSLFAPGRKALFGIALVEAHLDKRGFAATTSEKQKCLEDAGESFIQGYLIALSSAQVEHTAAECELLAPAQRGFAYEGSAMGLALLDLLSLGRPRLFRAFLEGPAQQHIYMAHVGAGWALARCPWGMLTFFPALDPLLKWLAIDGLGFHEGYFKPSKFITARGTSRKRQRNPEAFDNGLGRAIWFAAGARAEHVTKTLAAFPTERQAALWSGIGLAATYAGGASLSELQDLLAAAGEHRDEIALGAAFAAKARCRAENLTDNADLACAVFCQMDAMSAAAITDTCLAGLGSQHDSGSYAEWRDSIKREFASRMIPTGTD